VSRKKKYFSDEERREAQKGYNRTWNLANGGQRKAYDRAYYLANHEQRLVQVQVWQKANPEKMAISHKKRRARNKAWMKGYLVGRGCLVCGESRRFCLDFHHINPSHKSQKVSSLIWNGSSIATLEAEVEKCVVLCSNCHRGYHAGEVEI